jgi:putative nucleotidyltransferase with HDIG domain
MRDSLEVHAVEVARLAGLTARQLGISRAETDRIELGALLHDVGKATVPDSMLSKPGPLNAAEWEIMRTHTLVGERIVLGAALLAHVADLVRSSHERVDGGGYPDGLSGDAIPRGARIISVCDAFDAMTTDRPYRAAVPRLVALAELRRGAGSQFDGLVVQAFADVALCTLASLAKTG